MELSNEQRQALEWLYGTNPIPLCAVDENLHLLWNNACFEMRYLSLLQATINCIPDTPEAIVLHNGEELLCCTPEPLHTEDAFCYLLRFASEPAPVSQYDLGATIETLLACANENRETAGEAIFALNDVYRVINEQNCNEMAYAAVDRVLAACYRLLNQALRCEELSWYAAAEATAYRDTSSVDLTGQVSCLCEALDHVAGNLLPHILDSCFVPMWVNADKDRLFFTLLAMYLIVCKESTPGACIRFTCEQNGDFACVTMQEEPSGDHCPAAVHAPKDSPTDDTVLSNEALVQRFCKYHNAAFMRHKTERGCAFSLRIPLSQGGRLVFESPMARANRGRFTPEWIMLSAVLDYRHMGKF